MMDRLPANAFFAVLVFLGVALAVLMLSMVWEWLMDRRNKKEIADRLEGMAKGAADANDPFGDLFRDTKTSDINWLEPVMARLPHTADLQHLLEQADMSWRVGTFAMVTMGAGLAMGLGALILSGMWSVALGATAFGSALPYVFVKRKKNKRILAFEEHFPEAIDLLGRAIRAGHAFSTGLQMVADESPEPVATEFRQVFEEQKFGLALDDSMMAMADRIELLDTRIFVTALLIQKEVGGNLAEILDKLAYTIRERFMIQRQVRVYTAQGRFTGYLLAGLPIAVGFLIYMLNSEYMLILVREPLGRMLIAVAGLLQVIGYFVIRRIIDIKI